MQYLAMRSTPFQSGALGKFARMALALVYLSYALACSSMPPTQMNDICKIFEEKPAWFRHAKTSRARWGLSIGTQMAFIHQESRFDGDAKAARGKLLWVLPWFRQSSAEGYAQAVDGTWEWYKKETGNRGADRDDFADAVDFIGWYGHTSSMKLGIQKNDSVRQYLAFHEGHGGFNDKSYRHKPGLLNVAKNVAARARSYDRRLRDCEQALQRSLKWWFF